MELIKKLCDTYGPASREDNIRKIIKSNIQKYCKKIKVDRLGNLIAYIPAKSTGSTTGAGSAKSTGSTTGAGSAKSTGSTTGAGSAKSTGSTTGAGSTKRGNGDKIMFCAHMDEIGLIVTHIDKNGFLRFTNVGGIFPERILFERVIFENGTIGVIGVETKRETPKPAHLDNMFIDIGAKNKEEAQTMVRIGDIVAFHQQAVNINKRLSAKALDDRIGCYCLIETMKKIKANKDDLYFVFSVQEEVGLRGARVGAYAIAPKYAIAVDVTITGDIPESPKMDVSIGKGVAIKVKDSAFIGNPLINDKLVSYARKMKIPYQLEILERGTTDAAIIQIVKEGALSGVLSIPTRYVHSTNEVCDFRDVEATIKLLTCICEKGLG